LAGTGENFDRVQEASSQLPNFSLTGWLKKDDISLLLSKSYVGLTPCNSKPNTINNNPIQYFTYGLPIISSLVGEMSEMLEKDQLGFSYLLGDYNALVKLILHFADSPKLKNEISINVQKVYSERFKAETIYRKY
jgi:glycosyltransferase involved in cell wall biosynthesis